MKPIRRSERAEGHAQILPAAAAWKISARPDNTGAGLQPDRVWEDACLWPAYDSLPSFYLYSCACVSMTDAETFPA